MGAVPVVGLSLALVACARPPAEAQIRAGIEQGIAAARAAHAGALAQVLSDDFDGNDGAFDKRALVNLLRLARLRHESIKVLVGPVSLQPRGRRFVATFTLTLSGGRGWLPRHPGVFHVSTGWRNETDHWRCYSATWKRGLP